MTDRPLRHLYSREGTCADCKRKRLVFSIGRSGGGSYKRGGRTYRSSICAQCAVDALPYCGTHAGASHHGFDVRTIVDIAASLAATGFEGAAAALAAYTERKDAAMTAEAERRAVWERQRSQG